MKAPPTIGLVDDDPAFLRALGRLLDAAGYRVCAWPSATAFLEDPRRSEPECLIVDLDMPQLNGLDFHQQLAEAEPGMSVIFLTGKGSIPSSVRAMKQGAVHFFTKPVKEEELFPALEAALEKSRIARSNFDKAAAVRARYETLTPREREVMRHVISGKLGKQIADDLGTSLQTIKVHRMRVHEKMGVPSIAELVRLAAILSIDPLDPD